MTFKNGSEMLRYLWQKGDLYNPTEEIYVFHYSEAGSIAYYYIDNDYAKELAKESTESNEYWGAFLGIGGYIVDDPESDFYEEGDETNIEWCNDNYQGEWFDTNDYAKEILNEGT